MILHEYQSKLRFAECGIPIPQGRIARTSQEAYEIAQELGGAVVVKAQVLTRGRGKAGGIKMARNPEEARAQTSAMLGMKISGLTVHQVLVEPAFSPVSEIYLGITLDRAEGRPVMMASAAGGVEFESLTLPRPDAIFREPIDLLRGLLDYQTRNLAMGINLPHEHWPSFGSLARNLFECYVRNDALLAEINPLVIMQDDELLALDGRMVIDDNALYRHKDLSAMRDVTAEPESERLARQAGINYVQLDGQIGCVVNGAGLAMTTMDMIRLYGGNEVNPAHFLDIGGGARAEQIAAALRISLSDAHVRAVLVNIFGGITRCDEVALGLLQTYEEVKPGVPMIVRLQGTNALEARQIVDNAGIPSLLSAATLTEAAQKAVAAAQGAS